jgi:flagellar hook-associated protein 3 FlgL
MTAIAGNSQLGRQLGLTRNISLLNVMLNKQTAQLSTGIKAGGLVGVSSQAQELGDLKSQLGTVDNYSSAVQTALNRVNLYSVSIESVIDLATNAQSMMIENRDPSFAATSAPAVQANSLLNQIGTILQVKDGDRYLFSGTNYTNNPIGINPLSSIPTAYAAGAVPGTDYTTFSPVGSAAAIPPAPYASAASYYLSTTGTVQNYFDSSQVQLYVNDGEQISYGVSGAADGFQTLIDAVVRFRDATADVTSDPQNYQARVDDAMSQLNTAISQLKTIASGNGYNQQQLTEIQTQQSNTMDTLKIRIGKIQDADPAEVSTTISNLQTSLQASYYVTSSMLSLSLINYLK